MGRYVRRGSKGIALIDSSGERPRLRYVFDVSDTGGREFPKSRYLWEYREEHADAVSAMLESRYGVDGKGGLPDQLERIASQLAEEYWRDYKRDILAIVDDSFLYGYDEFNVERPSKAPPPSASPTRSCPAAGLKRTTASSMRIS